MENYAKIENEVVVNVIIADADFAEQNGYVLISNGAGIGWRYIDGEFLPPLPIDYTQQNKTQAEQLLRESDWVEYKSVRDTTRTPHLTNGDAWDDYRVALRGIAVNPPATEVTDWPVKPDEEWSN